MKKNDTKASGAPGIDLGRRQFLRAGALGGAALTFTKRSATAAEPSDTLNIALIGCGEQGKALQRALEKSVVPKRWVAVCDLLDYKGASMAQVVGLNPRDPNSVFTRPEEMLAKHPEIDAVFIATPDHLHAPFSRLCLTNKKATYCEKMMSNTLEGARDMVLAQRETGMLYQIGHQRRSNPRYHAVRSLIQDAKICGRMTHAYGQWNRGVTMPINAKFSDNQLKQIKDAGYPDPFQFLNWRWFKAYGGGPMSDLGAHQIDIFNWMLGTTPRAVTASGGNDFFHDVVLKPGMAPVTFDHPDTVIAVYEYDVPGNGVVRAVYQVATTNSSMNYYEKYMGVNGTVVISEADSYNQVYREKWDDDVAKWEGEFFGKGLLKKQAANIHHKMWERTKSWYRPEGWLDKEGVVDVRASVPLDPYELPTTLNVFPHTPHVENFLKVVQRKGKQSDLTCPVEEAYKCAVAVLKVNELIAKGGGRMDFKPEDFVVA